MTEAQIEARLERMVKDRGGLCYKWVSPNLPGVPDRIVVTPDGRTIYIELKTEVGRIANIQKWVHSEMLKRHADVRVLKGLQAVKDFVAEVLPPPKNNLFNLKGATP